MNDTLKVQIDFRKHYLETREVREGNKLLFQGRCNIVNMDDSIEYGKWKTSGVIKNYGDCFDVKPSFLTRLVNFLF